MSTTSSKLAHAVAALAVVATGACSSAEPVAQPPNEATPPRAPMASTNRLPRGAEPVRHEASRPAPARVGRVTAPQQQLIYFGGRVISNAKIVEVNWGPNVSTAISGPLGAFYTAITNSIYFDWLSEYDTIGVRAVDGALGTSQRIGRGSFAGTFTIAPTTTQLALSDTDISRELTLQIEAGKLPKPETDGAGNVNSLYMIDFPASVTITLWNAGGTATGCGSFGAYHSTVRIGDLSVPYGVHPDCPNTPLTTVTSIHSHEMIEAVTDPEVGLVDPDLKPGETRPSAWYSFINGVDSGEIADICAGGDVVVAGYTVQNLWSNSQGACVATSPTIICDGAKPPVPGCRACTAQDDGVACNGERSHCETDPANAKVGQCVVCTQSAQCPTTAATCKKAADSTDDTCVSTVACTGNGQCSSATPICDATSRACRACGDADCSGATPACEKLPGNVNFGRCVACTEKRPQACTGATPACDTFTNKCVACMGNSDCAASAPVCTFPAHTCAACTSGADCMAGGGVCATGGSDPNAGHCVQCASSADCQTPATCSTADTCSGGSVLVIPDAGTSDDAGASDGSASEGGAGSGDDASANPPGSDAAAGGDGAGISNDDASGGPLDDASGSESDGGGQGSGGGGGGSSGGCTAARAPSSSGEGAFAALLVGLVAMARRRRRD